MNEIRVYIRRLPDDDQGTIGVLFIPQFEWSCFTNELPNRNNERNYSRINPGEYDCIFTQTKKHGFVYWVINVLNRSGILIHSGTFAGDTRKGWESHVLGCIEVGAKVVMLTLPNGKKQRGIINSRSTRDTFQSLLQGHNFKLIIE